MNAAYEQAQSLTSADFLSQAEAIRLEREQAEEAVLERLTEDALRLMDLGICVMPEA